ncbi:MAG: hypothetical protein SVV03_00740 [Candidatus Nanohaloarchaea archaeon]|nr:hypothetical protein [Candidatus Nanohaloarchaea archaeon]
MRLKYNDCSTKMNLEKMLDQVFPTQEKYRQITRDILEIFKEETENLGPGKEIETSSIVSKLQERGHNRHTVYKLLREHLVPMGMVNWKKFEGTLQLSKKFGNALRNFSVSWKNWVEGLKG